MPPIRTQFNVHHRAAIAHHSPQLPPLAESEHPLLASLRTEGVAITSLDALNLEMTPQLLRAARSAKQQLAQVNSMDDMGPDTFMLSSPLEQMAAHPALLTWGSQPRWLNLIETYLQLPVAYHGVYLRRDLARPIVKRSRLWHTDMEDDHVLKIIVYLNDVDANGGPFEYVPKSLSHWLQRQLGHTCGYVPSGQVEKQIAPDQWKSCTGPAGTVIIVDTGVLIHRGKVPDRDRYTLFYDYTSRLPRRPYYCKSSLPESTLRQLTQGLSDRQKNCVFWRSHP